MYTTSDCTGTASETTALSQTCVPVTEYPVVGFDNVAYKWDYGVVDTGATFADGYVWVDLYQTKDCVGTVKAQQGHPTNKCLLLYANATSSTATGSYMYTCNNGKALFTLFFYLIQFIYCLVYITLNLYLTNIYIYRR